MRKLVTLITLFYLTTNLFAQEDGVRDLNLDELVAVDLEKTSMPISVDSVKALSGNTINLGLIMPISRFKEYTQELIWGAQLAADEINRSGKVLGKELFIIPADDAAESDFSIEKAEELIDKYNVAGLVGPTGSSRFIALVNEVLPKRPVVVISPSVSSVKITHLDDNDLAFRTAPSDALQGKTAALFSKNNLGYETAAMFHLDNAYGNSLTKEFKTNFEKTGGKVIGKDHYSPMVNLTHYDLTPRLAEILKSKPAVLYLVSNSVDIINIFYRIDSAQLFNEAYQPAIIGSDAIQAFARSEDIKKLEGLYGTSIKKSTNKSFEEKFKAKFGQTPKHVETIEVYDIVYLFALAIIEGKSTDAKTISTHIRSVSNSGKKVTTKDLKKIRKLLDAGEDIDYDGLNSALNFDQYGDLPDKEYQIWQVVDGKFINNIAPVKVK